MFYGSKFSGDISGWDSSNVTRMQEVFADSEMAIKLGILEPSIDEVKSYFLSLRLESDLQGASAGQGSPGKVRL